MLRLNNIIGYTQDPDISSHVHELLHNEKVENIFLNHSDVQRKRLRVKTDKGTDCAIAIPRNAKLSEGAVLLLEDDRAIVVKVNETEWIELKPVDKSAAIELGYFAGNMHWKVKFENESLKIALESPENVYMDRLKKFFEEEKIVKA